MINEIVQYNRIFFTRIPGGYIIQNGQQTTQDTVEANAKDVIHYASFVIGTLTLYYYNGY